MNHDDADDNCRADAGGRGKPPKSKQFKKGMSGNPAGRPRGSGGHAPHEDVLGQRVAVRKKGVEHLMPADEAFVLHLQKRAIEKDEHSAGLLRRLLKQSGIQSSERQQIRTIIRTIVDVASSTSALINLRMAKKLDPYRETARMVLEPWIVEAAIARLPRRLNRDEQRIVRDATRTPGKVKWPDWWEEF